MKNVLVSGSWWDRRLAYLIVCFITNSTSRKLGNRIRTRLLLGQLRRILDVSVPDAGLEEEKSSVVPHSFLVY